MSSFPRIDPNDPLTIAARETNDYAETHGVDETLAWLGIAASAGEIAYLGEQRALRAVAAQSGYAMGSNPVEDEKVARAIVQSPLWLDVRTLLVACYLDAIAIGWHGHAVHERGAGVE